MHTVCISVYTVSGNISRIAAILPELLQNCQNSRNIARNSDNTNLHAKSSIATTLQQYCGSILPGGLYYNKASVLTNNV